MKYNNKLFGTKAHPIRPSKLDKVAKCQVLGLMLVMEADDELGGKAAQTGQLVHVGAATFHNEPDPERKVQAGLVELQSSLSKFPLGDIAEAEKHYLCYVADPRNANAKVIAVEKNVEFELPPHPDDPTGENIYITGTLDQIRQLDDGSMRIYDIKTGAPTGWHMIHNYSYQLAAYLLAARANGFPVDNSVIIRTQGYRVRGAVLPEPNGIFFPTHLSVGRSLYLMSRIRQAVASIRKGEIEFGPGDQCTYCPLNGIESCMPWAETVLGFEPDRKLISLF